MTAPSQPTSSGQASSRRRDGASYAFGDVDLAAQRLHLLDRVFAEPSRSLLGFAPPGSIELAVDLGCGPGWSTRLVRDTLRPARAVGLDRSPSFLETARASGPPEIGWFVHDITSVPFPTGPADLLHARFVLCHLNEPEVVLRRWLGQLRPGGYLLAQDDQEIITRHPVLESYEEMARSLVAAGGGDLWVGARLGHVKAPYGFQEGVNRVYRHRVPTPLAAQMFAMNFAVWRHDPHITASYSDAVLHEMGAALTRLAGSDDQTDVVFAIRQLGFRRIEAGDPDLRSVPAEA
jgi:SAM-dependent methyltransferase